MKLHTDIDRYPLLGFVWSLIITLG